MKLSERTESNASNHTIPNNNLQAVDASCAIQIGIFVCDRVL